MDLKEIEAIIKLAKRTRVKSITVNGLSFDLRAPKKKIIASTTPDKPASPKAPTLDDINRFIYEPQEEPRQ